MAGYLEQHQFSQPKEDIRQVALEEAALANNLPLHDLRAVDIVERELLDPAWDYRTAGGIEERTFLPVDLISAILKSTTVIVRETVFTSPHNGQQCYVHAERKKSFSEVIEEARRAAAKEI